MLIQPLYLLFLFLINFWTPCETYLVHGSCYGLSYIHEITKTGARLDHVGYVIALEMG